MHTSRMVLISQVLRCQLDQEVVADMYPDNHGAVDPMVDVSSSEEYAAGQRVDTSSYSDHPAHQKLVDVLSDSDRPVSPGASVMSSDDDEASNQEEVDAWSSSDDLSGHGTVDRQSPNTDRPWSLDAVVDTSSNNDDTLSQVEVDAWSSTDDQTSQDVEDKSPNNDRPWSLEVLDLSSNNEQASSQEEVDTSFSSEDLTGDGVAGDEVAGDGVAGDEMAVEGMADASPSNDQPWSPETLDMSPNNQNAPSEHAADTTSSRKDLAGQGAADASPSSNRPWTLQLLDLSSNNDRPKSPRPMDANDEAYRRSALAAAFSLRTDVHKCNRLWLQMQRDSESLRLHGIQLCKLLGSNAVSTVYQGIDSERTSSGKPTQVVVKVMNWSQVQGDYRRSLYPRLLKIYENTPAHPNIVKTMGLFVDGPTRFLVTEWCPHRSLSFALGAEGCFARGMAEGRARISVQQICEGLQFLHFQQNLPHGRLTSENVLLDAEFNVKLSDFGYPVSTSCNSTDDSFHIRFRAPELLKEKPFSALAGDIWSLGVVLYVMLHAGLPYDSKDVAAAQQSINMPPLYFRATVSLPCRMFVKRLLSFSPLFRPSLTNVMTDPWMLEKLKSSDKHHPSCYHDQAPCELQQERMSGVGPSEDSKAHGPCLLAPNSSSTIRAISSANAAHDRAVSPRARNVAVRDPGVSESPYFAAPLSSPIAMTWKIAYERNLCEECLFKMKEEEEERGESEPGRLKRLIGRNGRKMTPRVSAMFEHYNPSSPDKLHSTLGKSIIRKRKSTETTSARIPTESEMKDQLMEFLAYSERARAKFMRYYAGVIPQNCREWVQFV